MRPQIEWIAVADHSDAESVPNGRVGRGPKQSGDSSETTQLLRYSAPDQQAEGIHNAMTMRPNQQRSTAHHPGCFRPVTPTRVLAARRYVGGRGGLGPSRARARSIVHDAGRSSQVVSTMALWDDALTSRTAGWSL